MIARGGAAAVALLALAAGVAGCGYRLAGRNQVLPDSIRVIAVPPFENRTRRPEIEQRITEQVTATFIRRGGYRVTADPGRADAVLEGAVTGYDSPPVSVGPDGRATRYEVVITAEVTLTSLPDNAVLFRAGQFVFKRQYDVAGSPGGTEEGITAGSASTGRAVEDFFNREILAIDLIARDFAEAVVTSILEGF